MERGSLDMSELLKEMQALRADIHELPGRIASAASKEIKREARTAYWTLIATIFFIALLEHFGFWK